MAPFQTPEILLVLLESIGEIALGHSADKPAILPSICSGLALCSGHPRCRPAPGDDRLHGFDRPGKVDFPFSRSAHGTCEVSEPPEGCGSFRRRPGQRCHRVEFDCAEICDFETLALAETNVAISVRRPALGLSSRLGRMPLEVLRQSVSHDFALGKLLLRNE